MPAPSDSRRPSRRALVSLLLAAAPCGLSAQGWSQRSISSPEPDVDGAAAFDSARGEVVFCPAVDRSQLLGLPVLETWTHAAAGWQRRTPVTRPAGRWGQSMAYDSVRGRVVMFGGLFGFNLYRQTWEWDGANWSLRSPAVSPSARAQAAMAFDSTRARTVLFAGAFGSGDTWEWDGTNWTQALPATQPPVRQQTAMAFDAQRGVCLLFGGWDGNVGLRFGDTWEWNGINWTQRLPATQPAPRTGHALVYDAARARIAMFGGSTGGGESAETWLWDGVNWTLANAVPSPTARERFAFAYDAASARTLLFGGNDGNADLGDTWTWDGAQWTQIGGQPGSEPGPRHQASMAYDAARGRVQLVGGSIVSLGAFPQPAPGASDLWEWDGAAWHLLLPASFQPPARSGYVIARDATRQETVMFGGDGSVLANETWIWNGVDWAQRFPLNRPLACRGHTLTYDPVRQQILLFGGNTTNQTWTWDGATWTLRSPAASPPARLWHAAVFDRRQQRVVMFGGYGYSAQNALADTWE
jgi:hypothetical protein